MDYKFHTPGPWHAGHIGDAEYRHEVVFDGNSGQVCEVTMPGVQGVHNARLIAASPTMKALIEEYVAGIGSICGANNREAKFLEDIEDKARAILASLARDS